MIHDELQSRLKSLKRSFRPAFQRCCQCLRESFHALIEPGQEKPAATCKLTCPQAGEELVRLFQKWPDLFHRPARE